MITFRQIIRCTDQKNILNLSRDKKIYTLSGDIFNADRLIENILMSDEEKIFSNDNFELILDIDKVRFRQ